MKKAIGLILLLMPTLISGLEITEAELSELESIITKQGKLIEKLGDQLKTAKKQLEISQDSMNEQMKSFTAYEKESEKIILDLKKMVAAKEREIHGLQWGLGFSLGANVIQGGICLYLGLSR
jgi:uncharacterized coiled-coil protein SlyX